MSLLKGKKICLVVSSLGFGGAEKSSALLSKLLHEADCDVHIVTVLNKIDYDYKGELLNLGILKNKKDNFIGRIQRLFTLKKYLKKNQFHFIIDSRTRGSFLKEFIISKLLYKSKKTIYNVLSYDSSRYINQNKILAKILYKNAYRIVGVSEEITFFLKEKYNFENTSTIQEAFEPLQINDESINIKTPYVLFFGRLDDSVKNISLLIESYAISILPKHKIPLVILGEGKDKNQLIKKSESLNLEGDIIFKKFTLEPGIYIKKALFTLLTSRYEGFPRSILESLSLSTPVISVDCKSGPSEMIIHKHNGLLVENHNPNVLAEAMNLMVEDKSLYLNCKNNATQSVNKFSKENITKAWLNILS